VQEGQDDEEEGQDEEAQEGQDGEEEDEGEGLEDQPGLKAGRGERVVELDKAAW